MSGYYQLRLQTREKAPKQKTFACPGLDLQQLNSIIGSVLENFKLLKRTHHSNVDHVLKLLDKLIPHEYFGVSKHRKSFYNVVKKICTQSVHECILKSTITLGYDWKLIPWLSGGRLSEETRTNLLLKTNIFLFDNVVKPLIAHYYKQFRTYNGCELKLVNRSTWQSFESRIYDRLVKDKVLVKITNTTTESRGRLNMVPKGDDDFRPVITIFPDHQGKTRPFYKLLNSKIFYCGRQLIDDKFSNLYQSWKKYTAQYSNDKLYAIKLDVKDAFGSVDLNILRTLVRLHLDPLLRVDQVEFILSRISNQVVSFRQDDYWWNHGLLQGDRLSSSLCELYMAYIDNRFTLPFLQSGDFVFRKVDDYVFCSTNYHRVYMFVDLIKANYQINEGKTKTSFGEDDADIPFCGRVFSLSTKEVRNYFNINPDYRIGHKFKLWNWNRPILHNFCQVFLTNAMKFSYSNNRFSSMELNTFFNTESRVLLNYFESMVYLAYKFDSAVMALGDLQSAHATIEMVLEKTLHSFSMKGLKTITKYQGGNYSGNITYTHLKAVSYQAFLLVLRRKSLIYHNLICTLHKKHRTIPDLIPLSSSNFQRLPPHLTFTMTRSLKSLNIDRNVPIISAHE